MRGTWPDIGYPTIFRNAVVIVNWYIAFYSISTNTVKNYLIYLQMVMQMYLLCIEIASKRVQNNFFSVIK